MTTNRQTYRPTDTANDKRKFSFFATALLKRTKDNKGLKTLCSQASWTIPCLSTLLFSKATLAQIQTPQTLPTGTFYWEVNSRINLLYFKNLK